MMNIFILILSIIFIAFPFSVKATLYFEETFHIDNSVDSMDKFSFNSMENILFLGATLGKSQNWILGQSAIFWNKTHVGGDGQNSSKISLLCLGPRITWFLNSGLNFALSAAYHPYAKGKRTTAISGLLEIVDGTSMFFQFSYLLEIARDFYLGASVNYHSVSIKTSVVDDVETKQALGYSNLFPGLMFSIRF